jgi:hypothetical protein
MYVFLSELEQTLHTQIRAVLEKQHGHSDKEWWMRGVPKKVREKCATARENDPEAYKQSAHLYSYTTLIQLKDILESPDNEKLFRKHLPASVANDLKGFFGDLTRLNGIRNQVMHPVRDEPPTETEFVFVREMHSKLCRNAFRS